MVTRSKQLASLLICLFIFWTFRKSWRVFFKNAQVSYMEWHCEKVLKFACHDKDEGENERY